jgi:hypothetical protein
MGGMNSAALLRGRLPFALALLLAVSASAAKKPERTWLTGTVLDATKERRSAVTGTTTTGDTTSVDERRWDEDTYLIDAGDRVYIISESIPRVGGALASVRVKKAARLISGSDVKYAVDRDDMLIQVDGKEHKFHIQRVSMKPKNR